MRLYKASVVDLGSFMYNLLKMNQHLIIHVQFKIFLHCPIFVSVMLKKQRCWNKDKTISYMFFFLFGLSLFLFIGFEMV